MKKIIAVLALALTFTGCTTTVNLALINSRSPATNALGTNDVDAATGYTGGGTVSPNTDITNP